MRLDTDRGRGCNVCDALDVLPPQRRAARHDNTARQAQNRAASGTAEGTPYVNKTDMIDHIATQADISKAAATRALEAFVGGVKTALKKGNSVSLVGFGTFTVTKRQARTGRNPRTKEVIKIKAAKVPKFRPGKALKEAL
jgi:DNA-binding protein HU-beta